MAGRVSRMLNALSVLDSFVQIKPVWAIRQEILQDAGSLKKRMISALSNRLQKKLQSNEEYSDKFDERFRELLRERYKLLYVDSGVLDQKKLDKELAEWIDYI